jgi:hypothetical protein
MIPQSHAVWSIWIYLPALARLFVVVLSMIALYSLFSAVLIVVRLRSLTTASRAMDDSKRKTEFAALERRAANLRQLLGLAVCLFGFAYFVGMQMAYMQIVNSSMPTGYLILWDFYRYFVLGANAFVVFLVLHCVQWFVSSRVLVCSVRLSSRG